MLQAASVARGFLGALLLPVDLVQGGSGEFITYPFILDRFASQSVAGLSGSGLAEAAGNQDLMWSIMPISSECILPLDWYGH